MAEIPRQLPADGAASRPVAPIARQIEHAGSRRSLLRQIARDRWMMVGLVIVAVIAALAILAPLLPLPDPDATEPARRLAAPGELGYALGSDQLGRDILSRIVWGGRTSLVIGFVSAGRSHPIDRFSSRSSSDSRRQRCSPAQASSSAPSSGSRWACWPRSTGAVGSIAPPWCSR